MSNVVNPEGGSDARAFWRNARHPTRHQVLLMLKVLGEASARTLAEHLHLTPMGVRRHLNALREDGWVDYRVVRQGRGRPQHLYYLTSRAVALFDQRYAALTIEFLNYLIEEQGNEVVEHLFARRAERRVQEALAQVEGLPLRERVVELTRILERDGYMAEWCEDEEGYIICEHHCAIQEVAQAFPQACASELVFLQDVLKGALVERVEHILSGQHRCTYRVRPLTSVISGQEDERL